MTLSDRPGISQVSMCIWLVTPVLFVTLSTGAGRVLTDYRELVDEGRGKGRGGVLKIQD